MASDKDVEAILEKHGMEPFTPYTITDIENEGTFKNDKKMGYAFDEMEHEEGIRCVAAPIYDIKGKVIVSECFRTGTTCYKRKNA